MFAITKVRQKTFEINIYKGRKPKLVGKFALQLGVRMHRFNPANEIKLINLKCSRIINQTIILEYFFLYSAVNCIFFLLKACFVKFNLIN